MTVQPGDHLDHADPPVSRTGGLLFVGFATATGVLALPFLRSDGFAWNEMGPLLLAGTISLSCAVLCHATLTFSLRHACVFFSLSCGLGLLAEVAGVRFGLPFGCRYAYHEDLAPRLFGAVPLFIPLSWFVLAYAPLVLLRGFEVGPGTGRARLRRFVLKAALCALLLAATDLLLDPLAVSVRAWTWEEKGVYLGVPIRNYLGWLLTGFLIYLGFFLLAGSPGRTGVKRGVRVLDGIFVGTCVLLTGLGHLAVAVHTGSFLPAIVSIPVVGPFFIYWFLRWRRPVKPPR